ncbi:sugar-binding domain-containing protein [Pullulanibacillus sp. KACC 23026]|uniref:sugar-binding transcriptional regulator n=1 Tax=Pullulanibacillus sp. KACC 23026 TaxID=3028315 RepID=UPI0023AFC92D|nr:sugar-binding domain-containing protein [Pullulanibacillus sp. KACC 23026]WEG13638.1 sugar-binding domain-containing protein [Pullulanibacillus sp. KACC 23026]
MDTIVKWQQKLVPDLLDMMASRYRILQAVSILQPIGRRMLSGHLGMTERVLRSEVSFLSEQGLLHMETSGMRMTEDGLRLLEALDDVMNEVLGIPQLEEQLCRKLDLTKVVVVPGDSDELPWIKNDLGLAAVKVMESLVKDKSIIAVTGGTTLASVAEMMYPFKKVSDLLFVSARGGLGEQVDNQANTICAKMAEKADGSYRLLHVPDQISESTFQTLIQEPMIQDALELIQSADVIVHGIGDAMTMAERRRSSEGLLKKIEEAQAVAETFGYYFNQEGQVVHKVKTVGLQLENLYENRHVIAIAGGRSKAKAIEAYFKQGPHSILVTDEGAARQLI